MESVCKGSEICNQVAKRIDKISILQPSNETFKKLIALVSMPIEKFIVLG